MNTLIHIVVAGTFLAMTASAQAHGKLVMSNPADGAQLDHPPSGLRLQFNEPVEAAFTKVGLTGPADQSVPLGPTLVDNADQKTRHSGLVIGMYVRPARRGSGVARALLQAAITAAAARPEIQSLRLTVTEGNRPAMHLYESVGFVAWGTEPEAILTPAGFKGKVHMSLPLRRADAVP
jgi:methionine-rich copper-binding protein CopC